MMNKWVRWIGVFGILLLALGLASSTWAVPSTPTLEAPSVEAFLDRIIQGQMERYGIPGVAVAVVSRDGVVVTKGYGHANVGEGIAVDPERTLFRIGSISKLFVWTAVMQLVEAGHLDLDADVNDYLDFEIPNRLFGRGKSSGAAPITLKHLMTHSAGFEDVPVGLFHLVKDQALPLEEYVRTHIPARVFPPGEVAAYSNYGSALAGYVVERVAGMPFAQYVEEKIFSPLQMDRSTFRQPVDSHLLDAVAVGYRFDDGEFVPGGFVYALEPAGGMSSTAADMARFMLAHLNGGMLEGQRILSEAITRRMHSPLFTQHPTLDGMAHGFLEQTLGGHRVLYHMGSVFIFNSGMYLLPETGVGLFVSYNGGSHMAPIELAGEFIKAFFPDASPQSIETVVPVTTSGPTVDPRRDLALAGEYLINRRSFTTDASLLSLLEAVHVDVDDAGIMYVTRFGQTQKFVRVEPGMYRNVAPQNSVDPYGAFRTLIFREGPGGELLLLSDGPMSYMKVPWYASASFTLGGIFVSLFLVVGTSGVWCVRSVFRRIRGRTSAELGLATTVRGSVHGFALISAGFIIGILSISGDVEPAYGVPRSYFGIEPSWAPLLKLFPLPMLLLGVGMAMLTVVVWRKKLWGIGGRIHYTVVTLSAWVLLVTLRGWHVI